MKVSNAGIAFIKKYEEFVDHIYDDGFEHPTIGYGHLVRDEDNLKVGQTITESEAEEFFRSDIAEVERLVNALPKISRITQNQFDAISSFVFNAGPDPVVKKDNDLYKALNKNTFVKEEVIIGFTYTNGRHEKLVKRRNAELDMFFRTDGIVYIPMNVNDSVIQVPVSANLTIQGSDVSVRDFCDSTKGNFIGKLNTGAKVTVTNRVLYNNKPWFYIGDYQWVSGDYVQGWIKDDNNNNRWWYVEKGYKSPTATWRTISGADYCFGKDGYLFVSCYIKAASGSTYYWVDENGVWKAEYNTLNPNRSKYRVVENYATENAYQG